MVAEYLMVDYCSLKIKVAEYLMVDIKPEDVAITPEETKSIIPLGTHSVKHFNTEKRDESELIFGNLLEHIPYLETKVPICGIGNKEFIHLGHTESISNRNVSRISIIDNNGLNIGSDALEMLEISCSLDTTKKILDFTRDVIFLNTVVIVKYDLEEKDAKIIAILVKDEKAYSNSNYWLVDDFRKLGNIYYKEPNLNSEVLLTMDDLCSNFSNVKE